MVDEARPCDHSMGRNAKGECEVCEQLPASSTPHENEAKPSQPESSECLAPALPRVTPEQRAAEFIKVKLDGISLAGNRGYFQQEITRLIRETEEGLRSRITELEAEKKSLGNRLLAQTMETLKGADSMFRMKQACIAKVKEVGMHPFPTTEILVIVAALEAITLPQKESEK